jgi:hypothetical protein
MPILIIRAASARAGEYALMARREAPKIYAKTFMIFPPIDDVICSSEIEDEPA